MTWTFLRNLMAFERSFKKHTVIHYIFGICEGTGRKYSFYLFFLIASRQRMGLYFYLK